jgi:hypothetical protein
MDGEADKSSPCISLNGCGWWRDTQSMTFLSWPGIEALYSGEQMTNATAAVSRRCSSRGPGGSPSARWTSWLNDGASNSAIVARSTSPPFAVIVRAASAASIVLYDPDRSDAEKTRKRSAEPGTEAFGSGIGLLRRKQM